MLYSDQIRLFEEKHFSCYFSHNFHLCVGIALTLLVNVRPSLLVSLPN